MKPAADLWISVDTRMKLFSHNPSPYARRVLVVAIEKEVIDQIEIVPTDPWSMTPEFLAANPLGKVPALLTPDGALMPDSDTICEYLDQIGKGERLIFGDRILVMARAALAQGIVDAAFAIVLEQRRPPELQVASWIERKRSAIERTLHHLQPSSNRFDLGDISLACALGYLDFRLPDLNWRLNHFALARWLDVISARSSLKQTAPN
jgi:glutathione S-transferase